MDCRDVMDLYLPDNSVDSVVTDPPYGLGFMGKEWDHGVPGVEFWRRTYEVLKPGGHLLAFSGSRTYHRMVCAIEDAGFEIRDQIMWVYGSGFPKSLDVSKAIDKAAGAEREVIGNNPNHRAVSGVGYEGVYQGSNTGSASITAPATEAAQQWQGWGTALKPAHEPICVARKPLIGTVAANVLHWGTGALNIDACRVDGGARPLVTSDRRLENNTYMPGLGGNKCEGETSPGRWPANLIHDGSDEVLAAFPQGPISEAVSSAKSSNVYGAMKRTGEASADSDNEGAVGFKMKPGARRMDGGSAARFFYCAKASKKDRNEGCETNNHPTVKPADLMAYLCRLVTPAGGVVFDPFMGSGSTGKAALREGFRFIGCEKETEYSVIAEARLKAAV